MSEPTPPSRPTVDLSSRQGDLTIGGDVVGNDKHVVNIRHYVANVLPLEQQRAFFAEELNLARRERFEAAQFDAYNQVWRTLQGLKVAGEDLWSDPSGEHFLVYAGELREVKREIRSGELFFDDEDRRHLLELLDAFQDFRTGKSGLLDIHVRFAADEEMAPQIAAIVAANRALKDRYERLLEDVRISFRRRLLGLTP